HAQPLDDLLEHIRKRASRDLRFCRGYDLCLVGGRERRPVDDDPPPDRGDLVVVEEETLASEDAIDLLLAVAVAGHALFSLALLRVEEHGRAADPELEGLLAVERLLERRPRGARRIVLARMVCGGIDPATLDACLILKGGDRLLRALLVELRHRKGHV